jgi:hypothetical protein
MQKAAKGIHAQAAFEPTAKPWWSYRVDVENRPEPVKRRLDKKTKRSPSSPESHVKPARCRCRAKGRLKPWDRQPPAGTRGAARAARRVPAGRRRSRERKRNPFYRTIMVDDGTNWVYTANPDSRGEGSHDHIGLYRRPRKAAAAFSVSEGPVRQSGRTARAGEAAEAAILPRFARGAGEDAAGAGSGAAHRHAVLLRPAAGTGWRGGTRRGVCC